MAISQSIPNPSSIKLSNASMSLYQLPSPSLGFQSFLYTKTRCLSLNMRNRNFSVFAASHDESKASDIGIEEEESKVGAEESRIAWEQTLASFKEQSLKLQSVSKEAYKLYSRQAMIILQETSEKLKIQAEKARQDLSVIAKEITEESKEYLATTVVNSPEPVKDIVETFASSTDVLYDVSKARDFYVGIPYGALLSLGGFLCFMFTGSIPAMRFGMILGGSLMALSISSLRSWKKGDSSPLVLKGQTAIATILFLRELRAFSMRPFIANLFTTIVSGGVVAFYIYRIIRDQGQTRESNLDAKIQDK